MKSVFRSNAPNYLTGGDRREWLSEEMAYNNDLTKPLRILLSESVAGQMDKNRAMASLFATDIFLKKHICYLSEQLQAEKHHLAEQAQQAKSKIYQLANFRREVATNKRYTVTGKDAGFLGGGSLHGKR